jgi:hypothetical protein
MADDKLKYAPVELTGRLITSVDPTQLGKGDFQQLTNMRYTNAPGIKAVQGMTKVNAASVTNPKIRAAYNFIKTQPAEQHLLVQGLDTNGLNPTVYDNVVSAPGAATFNPLYTETTGAGMGRFSPAPNGCFAYANGVDTLLWSGAEDPCAGFMVADTDDVTGKPAILYDYSSEAGDFTVVNYALIKQRYIHVASTRRLKGIKFYVPVATANSTVSAMQVYNWTSSGWTAVTTQVDGTATSGGTKTLGQTGWVTFDSTVTSAKVRYFNNTIGYWYLIDTNKNVGAGVDVTTQISFCTVDTPPQSITDLWDGVPRLPVSAFNYASSNNYQSQGYAEITTQVYKQDYVAGVTTTYFTFAGQAVYYANDYIVVGFTERMMGLYCGLTPNTANLTSTVMSVSYWNGSTWVATSSLRDGTSDGTHAFHNAGMVTWTPPSSINEFKTSVVNNNLFYYYKIKFTNGIAQGQVAYLDFITGVPVPKSIGSYKFPTMFQQRLALCCEVDSERNTILLSSINPNCVFNGTDSATITVGDSSDILAATAFFSRFSNNFYENLLVLKSDSVWVIDGTDPTTYKVYNVANMYGGVAPLTLVTCDIGFAVGSGAGATRNVSVWQTANNMMMWDGSVLYPISLDIEDVFDSTKSYSIEPAMVSKSVGFYDEALREYHWLWASKGSPTLNNEYVFDLLRKKWFTIDRTSGLKLQLGISVVDANGEKYSYGFVDTGYVERLEYGQTFDGQDMPFTFWSGDVPFAGWMEQVQIRNAKLIQRAKNTTANKAVVTIYGDGVTLPISTTSIPPANSVGRITKDTTLSLSAGYHVFHSFKATMTTNNEDIGFEPIGIGTLHKVTRYDI